MIISTENSVCAEYLFRSIGQKDFSRFKVLTNYSEVFIWKKISD